MLGEFFTWQAIVMFILGVVFSASAKSLWSRVTSKVGA